jgi:hypothetical protein
VSCDTSNHKHVKQLPILVCYFQAYDLEILVKNKLLIFVEISGKISDIIYMQMMKAIANYDIETKIVGLSANNTNTNLFRRCKENVLTQIMSQLNKNIIGFGCNVLIIHNCTKTAFDYIPVDIKVLVTKISGYFYVYMVCAERLKDFCHFAR